MQILSQIFQNHTPRCGRLLRLRTWIKWIAGSLAAVLFVLLFVDVQYMHEHHGGESSHSHRHGGHNHRHNHRHGHRHSHRHAHSHHHGRTPSHAHSHTQVEETSMRNSHSAAKHMHFSVLWFEFSIEFGGGSSDADVTDARDQVASERSVESAGIVFSKPDFLLMFFVWEFKAPHYPLLHPLPRPTAISSAVQEVVTGYASPDLEPASPVPERLMDCFIAC